MGELTDKAYKSYVEFHKKAHNEILLVRIKKLEKSNAHPKYIEKLKRKLINKDKP